MVETSVFSRLYDRLVSDGKLHRNDFWEFQYSLVIDPSQGDVIPGLGGLRKARLRSAKGGKRGGFRVDYLDVPEAQKLFLVVIYAKNVQEDLSSEEKRAIRRLVERLKSEAKL